MPAPHETTGIRLVVGLGNPGNEYDGTRHNAGFMAVDRILGKIGRERFESGFTAQSQIFSGKYRSKALVLQKPLTFMNSSGEAVATLCGRQKLNPSDILVIVDDMDLPLGTLRVRKSGSSGGHNGLKSIISELGSDNFNRVRIGIGKPEKPGTIDFVLGKFEKEQETLFEETLDRAAQAVLDILKSGMEVAMNKYNAATAVGNETKQEK